MPITKLGKLLVADEQDVAISAGEGLGGGLLLRNAINSGQLTGRRTLYHGTDRKSADSIRKSGLQPTTDANAVNTSVLKSDPERYNKSLNKAYTTPSALEAQLYARQTGLKKGRFDGGSVVKLNVPTWKFNTVVNPEVDMSYKEWKERSKAILRKNIADYKPDIFALGNHKALMQKQLEFLNKKVADLFYYPIYRKLRSAVVFDGGIPVDYIKDSTGYKRNSLKELLEYVKNRPGTFAKGLGKSLLGAGMLGHSMYSIGRQAYENIHN